MYEVFDEYVSEPDWYKGTEADRRRFHLCLSRIVNHPDFRPERMGEHLLAKAHTQDEALQRVIRDEIDARVADAWAVQDYLRYIGNANSVSMSEPSRQQSD